MWRQRLLSVVGILAAAGLSVATSRAVTLKASIGLTATEMVVRNGDSFEWSDVALSPEPCIMPLRRASLLAGQSWVVPLEDLRTVKGGPFKAETNRVRGISLRARIPGGFGRFEWNTGEGESPRTECS
jgi:hypothetical protein